MEELMPDAGQFNVGETVKIGYVDQSHKDIHPEKTVFEVVADGMEFIEIGNQKINARAYLSKFNFAGSGEKSWKTHKEKYQKEGLDRGTKDEKIAKREKYIKEKEATDQAANKTVVEYAGPIAKDFGVAKGLSDSGENSTKKNLEDAKLARQNAAKSVFKDFINKCELD